MCRPTSESNSSLLRTHRGHQAKRETKIQRAKWDHIATTHVPGATERLQRFTAKHNIPVYFKSGKHKETTAGRPRGTHTKTQTDDHQTICAVKGSENGTACPLEKPNRPSLNTRCTTEEQILLVETQQLTPADGTLLFWLLRMCLAHPEF